MRWNVAVTLIMRVPELSPGRYDRMVAELDLDASPPPGLILHVASEGVGAINMVELWQTRQAAESFVEGRLQEVLRRHGVEAAAGVPARAAAQPLRRRRGRIVGAVAAERRPLRAPRRSARRSGWHRRGPAVREATGAKRTYTSLPCSTLSPDRLQATLGDLGRAKRLDEDAVNKAMREIRLALLEADVNFQVVKDFVASVKARRARGGHPQGPRTPASRSSSSSTTSWPS